jgi:gas vesicle protein
MERNNNSNLNQLLMAFAAGAAIGAILGVLFAPDKGSETRGKVSDAIKGLSEDLAEKFQGGVSGDTQNNS